MKSTPHPVRRLVFRRLLFLSAVCVTALCQNSFAATCESFLEPSHRANLVPASRDIIQKIHVAEGDMVRKNQLLVSLNAEVLKARLQVADIMAEAHGRLESAKTVEKMRQDQLDELVRLAQSGNVRAKELDRAKADLAIAQAEVLTAQEEIRIRAAERHHIKAQLAEKEIRSPIDGVITKVNKEEGELTGSSDQDVLITVIQEYPLRAIFHLPLPAAEKLSQGQQIPIIISDMGNSVGGEVEHISRITNPESGTIKVKIKITEINRYRAGLRCQMVLAD